MHVNAHLDIDLIALDEADQVTCLLELTAPSDGITTQRPGRSLIVVLDRSGSMGGGRLEGAKQALSSLVRRLAPHDAFGLVVFDQQAEVIVPAMTMADHQLERMQAVIADLHPGGSTDLSAGYLLGLREAKRVIDQAQHASATVLIVSDGHANKGVTEPDRLREVARKAIDDRIVTSTVGLGLGYDEILLAAIAAGGNGNHRFAPDIDTAVGELQQAVSDLLDVSALATTVRIRPQGGLIDRISVRQDLPTWREPGAFVVNVGDLYAGEERKLLVQLGVQGVRALGTCTIAEIELQFTSVADLAEHRITLPVSVNVVPGDQARGRVPNPVVQVEQLLADVDEAKKTAAEQLRSYDDEAARKTLGTSIQKVSEAREKARGDAGLTARLNEAAAELLGLRDSMVDQAPEFTAKLMMDSFATTSRGRKVQRKPKTPTSDAPQDGSD